MTVRPPKEAVPHPSSSARKGAGLFSLARGNCWKITGVKLTCNNEPAQLHFVFSIGDVAQCVALSREEAVGLSQDGLWCSGAALFASQASLAACVIPGAGRCPWMTLFICSPPAETQRCF